jgi:hypothetical protein
LHRQGLESKKRALLHLAEFKQRIEQRRNNARNESKEKEVVQLPTRSKLDKDRHILPEIEVIYDLGNTPQKFVGGNDPVRLAQDQQPEQQKWIASLQEFNRYAKELLEKESGTKPIRIALIDDGVDFASKRIMSMVEDGRSYYQRSNKLNASYWISSGGHGTAMAGLIRTVCPMVKLFVIRLNEYTSENGRRQIYAESAAMVSPNVYLPLELCY